MELGGGDQEVLAPSVSEAAKVDAGDDVVVEQAADELTCIGAPAADDQLVKHWRAVRNLEAFELFDSCAEIVRGV